jgi:hypothetical protein
MLIIFIFLSKLELLYSNFKYGEIRFALLLQKKNKQLIVNNSTHINNTNNYPDYHIM